MLVWTLASKCVGNWLINLIFDWVATWLRFLFPHIWVTQSFHYNPQEACGDANFCSLCNMIVHTSNSQIPLLLSASVTQEPKWALQCVGNWEVDTYTLEGQPVEGEWDIHPTFNSNSKAIDVKLSDEMLSSESIVISMPLWNKPQRLMSYSKLEDDLVFHGYMPRSRVRDFKSILYSPETCGNKHGFHVEFPVLMWHNFLIYPKQKFRKIRQTWLNDQVRPCETDKKPPSWGNVG